MADVNKAPEDLKWTRTEGTQQKAKGIQSQEMSDTKVTFVLPKVPDQALLQ